MTSKKLRSDYILLGGGGGGGGDGQIVSLCIPRHISYAKHLAELISVCGACLERQNKYPKNLKGVVAIPLMFGSFRYASHSLKQSVYVSKQKISKLHVRGDQCP